MTRRKADIGGTLAELTKLTGVRLSAPDAEAAHFPLAIAVKDAPLRDVLRGLASLNGWQWRRGLDAKKQPVLTLHEADDPRRWDFLRPRNRVVANSRRSVRDFLGEISGFSPDARRTLARGVPFSSLPSGAQQAAREMVRAQLQVLTQQHWVIPAITPDNLDDLRVAFSAHPNADSTDYTLSVYATNVGDVMCATAVPDDPAAQDVSVTPAVPDAVPYQQAQEKERADAYAASREKAVAQDPTFRKGVSLKLDAETSLGFALAAIAPQARISIVAQPGSEAHTLSLSSVPLGDALDLVAAKYHCIWGVSQEGVVLFHSLPPPSPETKSPEEVEATRAHYQAMLEQFSHGSER